MKPDPETRGGGRKARAKAQFPKSQYLQPKCPGAVRASTAMAGKSWLSEFFDIVIAYVIVLERVGGVHLTQFVSPAHSFLPTLLSSLPRV